MIVYIVSSIYLPKNSLNLMIQVTIIFFNKKIITYIYNISMSYFISILYNRIDSFIGDV